MSPTEEIYLLEKWGSVTVSDVKYWFEQLDHTGCKYDSENLCLTAMKIKNSLGSALSYWVASVTEANTHGPVLFKIAVVPVRNNDEQHANRCTGMERSFMVLGWEAGTPKMLLSRSQIQVCTQRYPNT